MFRSEQGTTAQLGGSRPIHQMKETTMDNTNFNPAPERIRDDLGKAITFQQNRLDRLKVAYEAISSVDTLPADMPQAPVIPDKGEKPTTGPNGEKIDRRKWNGGNSTKAKNPKADGRRNNGRKAGVKKTTTAKKSTRKRATAKA